MHMPPSELVQVSGRKQSLLRAEKSALHIAGVAAGQVRTGLAGGKNPFARSKSAAHFGEAVGHFWRAK